MTEGPMPGDSAPDADRDQEPEFAPGPGYGQPPGYAQPPPRYNPYPGYGRPAAPKPGIIPLRPLSVGEILDGAFTAIRWNPKATLIPSAIVATISGVAVAAVTYGLRHDISTAVALNQQGQISTNQASSLFALYAAIVILSFFGTMILTGILTVVVGQGTLGRRETAGSAWQATRSRIFPLIGAVLLAFLTIVLGWAIAVGGAALIGVLIGVGAHLVPLGVLVGVVIGIAATVFAVSAGIRVSLIIPVVVLEQASPVASLRRSWRLVRGSAWRVFGILLLTELIVFTADLILRLPFTLFGGASSLTPTSTPSLAGTIVSAIGTIIAGTVTAPVAAGVTVLLYTDLRMRREGMDIALQAAAAAPGTAAAPPASPPPDQGNLPPGAGQW